MIQAWYDLHLLQDAGEDDEDIARRLQEEENVSRRPSRAVAKKPVISSFPLFFFF